MVKQTARQLARHSIAGALPFLVNLTAFTLLVAFNAPSGYQTVPAFVIGGQAAFWTHDRWSYRHRHPSLAGWQYRWCWFMPGQLGGAALNWLVAKRLNDLYDLSSITVYVAAMAAGVVVTFSWTNWLSHKDDPSVSPAEPALEHTHK